MYCPSCKDEFRDGFTRCAGCNVDLVADLSEVQDDKATAPVEEPVVPLRLAEYCGFFQLDEAREARDKLRSEQIRCEIVIREAPGSDWNAPAEEEYWLRADVSRIREVDAMLGQTVSQAAPSDPGEFTCGDCGKAVPGDAGSCPGCGARFEDD